MVPLAANEAASFPANLAIRFSNAVVSSSSPYTSSPRDARNAASNCASVGMVIVSPIPPSHQPLSNSPPPFAYSLRKSLPRRCNLSTFFCPPTSAVTSNLLCATGMVGIVLLFNLMLWREGFWYSNLLGDALLIYSFHSPILPLRNMYQTCARWYGQSIK